MLEISVPQAIVFDKDGTIIDAHHYWIEMSLLRINNIINNIYPSASKTYEISSFLLRKLGIDIKNRKIHKNGPAAVVPKNRIKSIIYQAFKDCGYNIEHQNLEEAFLSADESSKKELHKFIRLLPGVEKIISIAKKKKIDLNLVSNDITERSKLALNCLGFLDDFRFVFGQDEVKHAKPNPDLAQLVMMKGSYNENLVNIGDHPNDIKMGLAAGIKINIGVLTGLCKKEDFIDLDCFVINSLEELVIV